MSAPTPRVLHLLDYTPGPGTWNMALDEILLEACDGLVLRFYGWSPWTLSLGWFQDVDPVLLETCRENGWDVVRRATGGGAIMHARELTYSIVGPDGAPPFDGPIAHSYELVHEVWIAVLEKFGITAVRAEDALDHGRTSTTEEEFFCFARTAPVDLLLDAEKLLGSAKRRKDGRALQHGSLVLGRPPLGPRTAAAATTSDYDTRARELAASFTRSLADRLGLEVQNWRVPGDLLDRAAAVAARQDPLVRKRRARSEEP